MSKKAYSYIIKQNAQDLLDKEFGASGLYDLIKSDNESGNGEVAFSVGQGDLVDGSETFGRGRWGLVDAIDGWLIDEVDDSVDFGEGLALRNHGDFFINLVALARYSDQLARIFFQVWLLEKMESTLL